MGSPTSSATFSMPATNSPISGRQPVTWNMSRITSSNVAPAPARPMAVFRSTCPYHHVVVAR